MAPIIIDQPEDNLATNYINGGLVSAIKKLKTKNKLFWFLIMQQYQC